MGDRSKVKPTLTKGVAKVPVVMQLEALECGAACLAMVMAYYSKWVPLEEVRLACGVSRDGTSAKNMYLAAQQYGFDVKAFRMSPDAIKKEASYPCIIHWNMNHFVVLNGFRGRYAYINDPARGVVKVSMDEFDNSFTGIVIIPVPSENYEPSGKRRSTVEFARKRLVGAGVAVVFVMLATIISYLFGIVNSVTSRIFLDRILNGKNPEWLYPFVSFLFVIAAVQIIVSCVQAVYSLKINGKMSVVGSTSYMWKVLHLPMEFFSQRLSGDIQSRIALNSSVAGSLANTFAPLILNSIMMVFYLVLMLRQSVLLTLIGLSTMILNTVISRIIAKKNINIARVQMRDNGILEATTVAGIDMVETIKASGAETGFFQKWAGHQAAVNSGNVEAMKISQTIGLIPTFIGNIANYSVLILGVWLTMEGQFSLGGVMMFQGFLGSFMAPAMTLVNAGRTIQEMRTQMERIEDVMEYPEDVSVKESPKEVLLDESLSKIAGNVEIKNLTFGYSKLSEPIIKDFTVSIKQGQKIALVGATGCGKSTISKLISGMYQPWSGEILFDGKPRDEYPRDIMVGSIAVVDQHITLYEDSIENNIKMWDDTIMDFEVMMAAKDAQIHDDILNMKDGYRSKVLSGGRNLSGGQRQRLEIARVLAQDPTIIILDEATSALDAKTEYKVMNSIVERGVTCILIAHRLSSIRDCDEIIVLDHGKVVERGTHEELMKLNGAYAELIENE